MGDGEVIEWLRLVMGRGRLVGVYGWVRAK